MSIPRSRCVSSVLRPASLHRGGQSASRSELAGHAAGYGADRGDDIAQHPVDGVFIEDSKVAVSQQVHLKSFEFQTRFVRLILDGDRAVIRKARLGTDGCVLGKANRNFVARKMVRPGFERGQLGVDSGSCMRGSIVGHCVCLGSVCYTN